MYAHFCGGESIDDSEETMAKLAAHNVRTILDYSAEGQTAEADLDATCSEVLATIQAADGDARHAFAVFKVSGLSSNALLKRWESDGGRRGPEPRRRGGVGARPTARPYAVRSHGQCRRPRDDRRRRIVDSRRH